MPAAQEVRKLVQEGVLDSMSVVFHDPVRKTMNGVPTIVGGELLSVDFVSIPSNRDARVLSVRGRPGPASVTDVDALIAQARMALLELDAMDSPDPLAKTYRIIAHASAVLADLDTRYAYQSARRTISEAEAFLSHLNGRRY